MDAFQGSGEEIERALMDLGPLLGVSIKEEAQEEVSDPATAPPAANNAAGTSDAGTPEAEGDANKGDLDESPASIRCVLCSVLLLQASGTPKLMECLHSICEPCVKAKIDERQNSSRDFLGAERITITCPICRLQCQPANMIDQRFIIEKITDNNAQDKAMSPGGMGSSQVCSSCEEPEPASSYCVDCGDFICDSCVQAHQRLKITKDHTIKSKEEALIELQASQPSAHDMYCAEHTQERLSLFCETCERLTCRDCQLQHHRDHKYQFSGEMAAQARSSIQSLASEVSYKRALLGSAMKVIRDRQLLIADKKKALVREITNVVVRLTNAINTRGKQLVLRLSEVCDSKLRTLSDKQRALQTLAAITQHALRTVDLALGHGSDTAILYSKRALCNQLQAIKARRADIPNPEIPVRIGLALDKMPELLKVLSTIGGIVVDGKVEGAPSPAASPANTANMSANMTTNSANMAVSVAGPLATMSQAGPYQPHNSAVVALQHVAMQQPYACRPGGPMSAGPMSGGPMSGGPMSGGPMSGGVGPYGRRPTPLRHAHVTSTTHPHHLHGMGEVNLRGLLSPARGARHHTPHAYHQMMSAYAAAQAAARRAPQTSPAPAPGPAPAAAPTSALVSAAHSWHTPQLAGVSGVMNDVGGGADYKITLQRPPSAVTSTNPKTPSPTYGSATPGGSSDLDKVCAESVQDLLATIAKLDSNGVQVLPETVPPPSPAQHPHSSTDDVSGKHTLPPPAPPADPNEDWCAVCLDGGELVCCDKCPKVFHQYCHIPTIDKLPHETESWQCLLCVNFAEMPPSSDPARLLKVAERITLELYCQYELSLPFREPVANDNLDYYGKIPRPMWLDRVRARLQPGPSRYVRVEHFLRDCRLMFQNAYTYNPVDSQLYKDARRLEEFFDLQLVKLLPQYAGWRDEEPQNKRPRLQ